MNYLQFYCKHSNPNTIKRSFREAGIWPYNPDVVISQISCQQNPDPEPSSLSTKPVETTPKSASDVLQMCTDFTTDILTANITIEKLGNAVSQCFSQLQLM
jgi:hypothetical protein